VLAAKAALVAGCSGEQEPAVVVPDDAVTGATPATHRRARRATAGGDAGPAPTRGPATDAGGATSSARSGTGSTSCDAVAATTAWTRGADEDGGCQLVPERSSAAVPGGWQVAVTTSCTTSWEGGTDGGPPEGGALGVRVENGDFALPVVEVQSLVSSAG